MKHGEHIMALSCDTRPCRHYFVVAIILVYLPALISTLSCVFDSVKPRRVVQTNVSYPVVENLCMNSEGRCKRDVFSSPTVEDYFQPVRIRAYFASGVETSIDSAQRTHLMRVINRIILTASRLFSGKLINV